MIAFTFNQVKYVLYNYYELSRGEFPAAGIGQNLAIRVPLQSRARFEAACLLAGEVGLRVKRCGLDGLITEAVFMGPEGLRSESSVAREYHLDQADVHRRINRVVCYCEGKDLRPEDYETWRKENRNRRALRR